MHGYIAFILMEDGTWTVFLPYRPKNMDEASSRVATHVAVAFRPRTVRTWFVQPRRKGETGPGSPGDMGEET